MTLFFAVSSLPHNAPNSLVTSSGQAGGTLVGPNTIFYQPHGGTADHHAGIYSNGEFTHTYRLKLGNIWQLSWVFQSKILSNRPKNSNCLESVEDLGEGKEIFRFWNVMRMKNAGVGKETLRFWNLIRMKNVAEGKETFQFWNLMRVNNEGEGNETFRFWNILGWRTWERERRLESKEWEGMQEPDY